jgi:serine phosphatase RsbU (regulator of sigma subunit)
MTAYELVWLRFVKQAIQSNRVVSRATWTANIFVESLTPTIAVLLQIHTSLFGPQRALTSPVVAGFFLFIILSTLHLDPVLSRLAGVFSVAGYAAAAIYEFVRFPAAVASEALVLYSSAFSYAALLLVGGFAAGVVAQQIRLHVIAALHEAEAKAKIAQLEHDLGIARSIQQGLLPKKPPSIQGFDVAGWNRPADETGGDYFDWQQLADGRVALTVADATGHGIGPALVMSACRAYARAGFATETDLRNFLTRLNRLLYEDLPPEKFVTLVAGLLDAERGTVNLISAGHGPLLFYSSAEDRFREVDAQGPPLALLPRVNYGGAQLLEFAPGDILVLVTDGFIEWANKSDEDFGVNRLQEVVRAHRCKPSAAIISELHSAIVQFVGSMPQNDDLTAVVVKRDHPNGSGR